jgi:hypothetical protein
MSPIFAVVGAASAGLSCAAPLKLPPPEGTRVGAGGVPQRSSSDSWEAGSGKPARGRSRLSGPIRKSEHKATQIFTNFFVPSYLPLVSSST